MKRDIILLPSLLLASGFESLKAQDIKFLNNYRSHFDKTRFDLDEIFMITDCDYDLGGIMNPFNQIESTHTLSIEQKPLFNTYPKSSRQEIKDRLYTSHFNQIMSSLQTEVAEEFHPIQESNDPHVVESVKLGKFNNQAIEHLKNYPLYQKVAGLHLCGLGLLLGDAFNWILE